MVEKIVKFILSLLDNQNFDDVSNIMFQVEKELRKHFYVKNEK